MKRNLMVLSVLILSLLMSCDNVSTDGKTGTKVKTNATPKLKALSYKMKNGNLFNSSDDEADLDMGKALNLFITNADYIDMYDPSHVESYKMAFVDFMFETDTSFLEFENVMLGNLELNDESSYWIDLEDSTSTEGSGIDFEDCSAGTHEYHIYSWFQEDDTFPSELEAGATPAFSADYNGATFGGTLDAIPAVVNGFKELTTDSEVDLNVDFTIEFKGDLPAGTFVGLQVIPLCDNASDSLEFTDGDEIYNLYLETELTESASSVTFTAEMLEDIKDNIDDVTKVIADVFVFSNTKHGEINIDGNGNKVNVILNASSAVSVHLKK